VKLSGPAMLILFIALLLFLVIFSIYVMWKLISTPSHSTGQSEGEGASETEPKIKPRFGIVSKPMLLVSISVLVIVGTIMLSYLQHSRNLGEEKVTVSIAPENNAQADLFGKELVIKLIKLEDERSGLMYSVTLAVSSPDHLESTFEQKHVGDVMTYDAKSHFEIQILSIDVHRAKVVVVRKPE
jgi:hypothetical protein